MGRLRFLTAGESHGQTLGVTLEGVPAGLALSADDLAVDLARRQRGYGRGARQAIEQDRAEIVAGVRHGLTLGSPILLLVRNRDWDNWTRVMQVEALSEDEAAELARAAAEGNKRSTPVTRVRPGHADLAGALKYGLADVRDALERASARHTAAIVAAGATGKALLREIGITVEGSVLGDDLEQRVDEARADRDTVGGVVEVRGRGVPPGLGSYATKEERLDARLAATLMGTQAVKGVEIGAGFDLAQLRGSEAHDEIYKDERGFFRKTNHAGGLEGGMTDGEEIVVRAAMKPLPTLMRPLASVDLETGAPGEALVERSDTAAV